MGEPVSNNLQGANPSPVAESVIYDAALFASLREAVVFTDFEGTIIYWNEGATRLFGWTAEEMVGRSYFDRFPEGASRDSARQRNELLRRGGEIHVERLDQRKDGTAVWVEAHIFQKKFLQGHPVGIVLIFKDITERKQADEALRQSEEQFRLAMEHSAIGMALVAPDGKWLKANQALCHIVGYTEQELLVLDFQTITHPDDLANDLAHLNRLLDGKIKTYQIEKRYFHKDGHIVWILLNVSLVQDASGQPRYFISQIQDISQRHLAAETIQRDAHLLAQVKDAILCVNTAGIVTYWNDAATQIWGWSALEMMGQSVFKRLPDGPAREWGRERFAAVMDGGEDSFGERHDYRKDGSRIWLEVRSTRIKDAHGQPMGLLTVARDITQRRKAEQMFRGLLESAPDSMVIINEAGQIVLTNAQTEVLFGYTRAELQGRDMEILLPEWLQLKPTEKNAHQMLEEAARAKESGLSLVGRRKDGVVFPVEISLSPIEIEGGMLISSSIRDVTSRHQAEETVRRNAEIFAQLHDCVVCTGFDGRITYWNEAATKLHGWSAQEMQGRLIFEMFPPETRANIEREFAAFGDRSEMNGAFLVRNKDDSCAWMQIRVTPYKDDLGRRCGFIVVARDITERKLADEKLRQSESMMAAAQRIARFGSWELDLTTTEIKARPLQWSDECYRIFGYEPGSIQGTNELFFSRVPPEEHESISQAVSKAIAEKGEYSINHRVILPGGETRHIHEQARVFVDERTGQPLKMIGTAHDVTERVLVMEELVRAKEAAEAGVLAKSQFLAVLSHEIRTPLNPILGAAQLLLDQQMVPDQRELLEIIIHAGEHLQTLLNDMLDLAKMESGRAALTMAPCKISDLVRGVFDIKGHEAGRKGLVLHEDVSANLAFCYLLDEARLRQVLLNLVGNAVKFTPRGTVTVCAEKLATLGGRDQIRFSVRDTGIGLQPAHTQRIFEPFYQVDSSSTRRYEGAGLGLAICRRLVELMEGQIGVESEFGQGSTFWFTVWLERGPSAESFGEDAPAAPALATGERRVLLVEDDKSNRTVLVTMLERAGCVVTEAGTATAALELFEPGAYDLVLMDLRMPDLDGSEAARRFRERERAVGAPPTPIVAQTANSSTRDLEIAKDAGMNDFLAKPIRRQRLLEILNRHMPQSLDKKENTSSSSKSAQKNPPRNGSHA